MVKGLRTTYGWLHYLLALFVNTNKVLHNFKFTDILNLPNTDQQPLNSQVQVVNKLSEF